MHKVEKRKEKSTAWEEGGAKRGEKKGEERRAVGARCRKRGEEGRRAPRGPSVVKLSSLFFHINTPYYD
ncbi:hypothetical protein [Bacillus coahuilensis]|uniref:hypothetical protein n=1 Tax=Bacillus coahuilensis TaxID=408580 RepID=UPI0012AC89A1|nr:hypothetical protein [Bacillus coahuilensis]